CSYEPLAHMVQKVLMEQPYHLAHWKMWITQLQSSTDEGKERIQERIDEAWERFQDVLSLGDAARDMERFGLMTGEDAIKDAWHTEIEATLISVPDAPLGSVDGHGRRGEHTRDLAHAIETMAEVYNTD